MISSYNGDSVGVFSTDTILSASTSVVLNVSYNDVTLGCPQECFLAQIKTMISTLTDSNTVTVELKGNNVVYSKTKLQYQGSLLMLKNEGQTTQNLFTSASFDPDIQAGEVAFAVNNNTVRIDDNSSLSDSDTRVIAVWFNAKVSSGNKKLSLEVESNSFTRGNGYRGQIGLVCFHCTHNYVANNTDERLPSHAKISLMYNEIHTGSRSLASFLYGSVKGHDYITFSSFPREGFNFVLQSNEIYCDSSQDWCIPAGSWLFGYSKRSTMEFWSMDASAPCNMVYSGIRGYPIRARDFVSALDEGNTKFSVFGCGSYTDSSSLTLSEEISNSTTLTGETPTFSENATFTETISASITVSDNTFTFPPTKTKTKTKNQLSY